MGAMCDVFKGVWTSICVSVDTLVKEGGARGREKGQGEIERGKEGEKKRDRGNE